MTLNKKSEDKTENQDENKLFEDKIEDIKIGKQPMRKEVQFGSSQKELN